MKRLSQIIFLAIVAVWVYVYRSDLQSTWSQAMTRFFPCKFAITYSLGEFDTRFGISKEDFLKDFQSAENIWEKQIGKELFKYTPDGSLKVNLIYDTRQKTTNQLKDLGVVVDNTKDSYDALKAKYNSAMSQYNADKSYFESQVDIFNQRKEAYDAEVSALNKKGGADKQTYNRLVAEQKNLNQEVATLTNLQNNLNKEISNINSLASALNQVASALNLKVKQYNTIGSSLGGEFEEGTYEINNGERSINIYQFESQTKLIRVLAHELGHALGLEHNDDSKAIMYRLNNGINEKLTSADLLQLKNLCGIN